jgi:hypothetical protein
MSYRPRHARKAQPPLFFLLLARLVSSGALALDPAPALSKHWRGGTTGRLTAATLLATLMALALVAAMLTAASVPLARWMIH